MGETKTYAFGDSKVTGIRCPVRSTGRDLGPHELTVAEEYDEVVRERYGIDEGVLPESVAASAWRDAVSQLKQAAMTTQDKDHAKWLHESVEAGEEIESEVF
jgi:hypothetical protein